MSLPNAWAAKHGPPALGSRKSPWLQKALPISFSSAASTDLVGGQYGSLESVARTLPFCSDPPAGIAVGVRAEAAHTTASVLSLSHSTKLSGRKRTPSFAGGHPDNLAAGHADHDDDEPGDRESDYVPVMDATDQHHVPGERSSDGKHADIIDCHRRAFMERMFPPDRKQMDADNPQKKSGSILSCWPQVELDYIKFIVKKWQVGVEVQNMVPGQDRDELLDFRRQHVKGNKYVHQYYLEEVCAPVDARPRNVVRRKETKGKHKGKDRIVLSREQLFDCIDEWHRGKGHMGQERTWTYCSEKYYNVTVKSVKLYCELCITCMRRNPVTQAIRGSIKPIRSWPFCDRFQVDLVDFCKLRKRDPFGVLMRWVMMTKDHATGLTHLCALPRKRPLLVAYKLQELFGVLGFPRIFHTGNVMEFTAKSVLEFLLDLNPGILAVTGQARRPCDQGSV
jgi:hypothetical protein